MCNAWQANRKACCRSGSSKNSEEANAVPHFRGGKLVMRRIESATWLNRKADILDNCEVGAHVRKGFRREIIWRIFVSEKANGGR